MNGQPKLCCCLFDEIGDITFSFSICIVLYVFVDVIIEYFNNTEN